MQSAVTLSLALSHLLKLTICSVSYEYGHTYLNIHYTSLLTHSSVFLPRFLCSRLFSTSSRNRCSRSSRFSSPDKTSFGSSLAAMGLMSSDSSVAVSLSTNRECLVTFLDLGGLPLPSPELLSLPEYFASKSYRKTERLRPGRWPMSAMMRAANSR